MTYKEQLLNQKWLTKRKEILKEHQNTCQNCFNQSYEEFDRGIILSSSLNKQDNGYWATIWGLKNNEVGLSLIGDISFNPTENYVCFYEKSNNYFNIIALKRINHSIIEINSVIEIIRQGIKGKVTEKTYKEVYKPINANDIWVVIFGLHIHHKYYQHGLLAWEYPNEALQTLCWKCHENLHANSAITILNKDGIEIGQFSVCKRCYGAGIFPEYSHIQAGICFRCNGAKYEELIYSSN